MLAMRRARSLLLQAFSIAPLLAIAAARAQAGECSHWPGEPRPLPQVEDRDPLRARWAGLRAQELARRARELEPIDPVSAHQAWRRVLCLDPADERALAGALRTLPLRVHRPEIEISAEPAPDVSDTDVWLLLDAPVVIALRPEHLATKRARPGPGGGPALEAPQRAESLWRVERALAAAESQVEAARFDEALESVGRARATLAGLPPGRDLDARRLRLELVAAEAEAARGRSDEARACLARVLVLDPGFRFDARTTSPKLVRLLDAARVDAKATP